MIFFNGQYLKDDNIIPVNDSGFTTAIGIFDSMLSYKDELIHCIDHFDRILFDSKNVIGIEPKLSFNNFVTICRKLLAENKFDHDYARIRTTITGGIANAPLAKATECSILIHVAKASAPDENTPITAAVITDHPRIAGCVLENSKRLDYTRSYAARRKAENKGAQEAIITNTNGTIACGATSNIFIKENLKLVTPPLSDGVLAGVTRKNILRKNKAVIEESISIDRLKAADEVYLTNSFFGMKRVKLLH